MARLALWLVAAAVVLYGLHRLARWLEDRGAIYYLRRKPSGSTLGNAFLEVQTLLEPDKRVVVEERKRVEQEEDEAGAPPEPGG